MLCSGTGSRDVVHCSQRPYIQFLGQSVGIIERMVFLASCSTMHLSLQPLRNRGRQSLNLRKFGLHSKSASNEYVCMYVYMYSNSRFSLSKKIALTISFQEVKTIPSTCTIKDFLRLCWLLSLIQSRVFWTKTGKKMIQMNLLVLCVGGHYQMG